MYEQIARNKRRAVLYLSMFFVLWVGIGALLGFIWAEASARSTTTYGTYGEPLATSARHANVGADVATGMVVFGILAALGIVYVMTAGGRLGLAASGGPPAPPPPDPPPPNNLAAPAIGDG